MVAAIDQQKIVALKRGMSMLSMKQIIRCQFEQVAREQDKVLAALRDDTMLVESGLDSLCFAIIVVRLEDLLGTDPFAAADEQFPLTFGDFVRFYEHAAE